MQLAGLIRNLQYPDVLELVLQILKCELFQSYTIIHLVLCYLTGPGVKNARDRSEPSDEGFEICILELKMHMTVLNHHMKDLTFASQGLE